MLAGDIEQTYKRWRQDVRLLIYHLRRVL